MVRNSRFDSGFRPSLRNANPAENIGFADWQFLLRRDWQSKNVDLYRVYPEHEARVIVAESSKYKFKTIACYTGLKPEATSNLIPEYWESNLEFKCFEMAWFRFTAPSVVLTRRSWYLNLDDTGLNEEYILTYCLEDEHLAELSKTHPYVASALDWSNPWRFLGRRG